MKGKITVYLETSVISVLFDKRVPEMQHLTQVFFEHIEEFDAYVSEVVLAEVAKTRDEKLRDRLLTLCASFSILPIDEESRLLANEYMKYKAIPEDYPEDALHIAIATVNGIDYLLSWNFEHLVKIKTRKIVSMVNVSLSYPPLEIVTPAEMI